MIVSLAPAAFIQRSPGFCFLGEYMADRTNEAADIAFAEELVFSPCGLVLEPIQTEQDRTPDFCVLSGRGHVAYCEVKSPRDDWLDEQLEQAQPGMIVGGARDDPTFNRIARHIQKAVKQFDAVNSDQALPNVLVFVNHADACGAPDLFETLTGYFHADDGTRHPTIKHISEDRLGRIKGRIDLYIWIDAKRRRVTGWIFSDSVPERTRMLKALFRQARERDRAACSG